MAELLESMRDALVDQALAKMNEALQRGDKKEVEVLKQHCTQLTNPGWQDMLVQTRPATEEMADFVVLAESEHGPIAQFRFHDTFVTTVFAARLDDSDQRGWVDPQGLSFYERMRYAGYKTQFVWKRATKSEWEDVNEEFRVLHPRELLYHPKTRRFEIVRKPDKFQPK